MLHLWIGGKSKIPIDANGQPCGIVSAGHSAVFGQVTNCCIMFGSSVGIVESGHLSEMLCVKSKDSHA